jgi:Protein of unknown function (DUF732)
MSIADDQTLSAPDESATGAAATMAAPETADSETAVIPPSNAVTPLAWSLEEEVASEDVVPYSDTGTVEVAQSGRSWWLAVGIGTAVLATAGLITFDAVLVHHHSDNSRVSAEPTTHEPLACPAGTKPGNTRDRDNIWYHDCEVVDPEPTTPPVTVVPPPVTVLAIPPTITQTIAPNPRAVFPTLTPTTGEAAFETGIAEHPDSEPMPPMSDALIDGHEVCNRMSVGQSRRDIENTLVSEHGLDFGSAAWIWVQADRKLCPR